MGRPNTLVAAKWKGRKTRAHQVDDPLGTCRWLIYHVVCYYCKMFDCHSHVQFAAFEKDWKAVIERTLQAGVSIINVGTQRDTSAKAVEIANQYKSGVYATVGLHPVHTTKSYHDANELGGGDAAKAFVSRGEEFDHAYYRKLASDPKVVALGECGLDYFRPTGDPVEYKKLQRAVFVEHVAIALK